ncbi:hypothetical protein C8R43DRAFT_1052829 [Mycena crocata]|nr:hypothetical protein C8R43DRAFT_1052829 [Mycena crocata]
MHNEEILDQGVHAIWDTLAARSNRCYPSKAIAHLHHLKAIYAVNDLGTLRGNGRRIANEVFARELEERLPPGVNNELLNDYLAIELFDLLNDGVGMNCTDAPPVAEPFFSVVGAMDKEMGTSRFVAWFQCELGDVLDAVRDAIAIAARDLPLPITDDFDAVHSLQMLVAAVDASRSYVDFFDEQRGAELEIFHGLAINDANGFDDYPGSAPKRPHDEEDIDPRDPKRQHGL